MCLSNQPITHLLNSIGWSTTKKHMCWINVPIIGKNTISWSIAKKTLIYLSNVGIKLMY
jgi:hypothetical protein